MKQIIIYSLGFLAVLLLTVVGYFWITYTSTTVTEGEAFGFTIGDSKKQTYQKAPQSLHGIAGPNKPLFLWMKAPSHIANEVGVREGNHVFIQTAFSDNAAESFFAEDKWTIYFEASFNDFIRLSFCDDKLCEIYRHRQYFELP